MAPEIHMRKPYNGASVDLFACAIILFIMTTQHPPFTKAEPTDAFYRLICANRADLFWKAHSKNKPDGFFTQDFISLITSMLQFDPAHRLSMAEVIAHPWFNGSICSLYDAQAEFAQRKLRVEAAQALERQTRQAKRTTAALGVPTQRRTYRGVHKSVNRGDADTTGEDSKYDE